MPNVVICQSQGSNCYHKNNGNDRPACNYDVNRGIQKAWYTMEKAEAKIWHEPCQRPDCYGDFEYTGGDQSWP